MEKEALQPAEGGAVPLPQRQRAEQLPGMPLVRDHGVFQGLVDQFRAAALVGGMRLVGLDGAQVGIEQHLVAPRQGCRGGAGSE